MDRRACKVDQAVVNQVIQLRACAQALMKQADLAAYRAVMATRIAEAIANALKTAPNPQPDHDVMPSASSD